MHNKFISITSSASQQKMVMNIIYETKHVLKKKAYLVILHKIVNETSSMVIYASLLEMKNL